MRRFSAPRLPRPRLPRVRLPRPPEAVIEAGRVPVELGREGWDWWLGLSIYTRRRLCVAAGLLAVLALIWLAAIPALPCGAPGGESCPPRDDAIGLVPDDALAYAHVNLDRGSDQFKAAEDVASRVPTLAQQAIGRLAARLPGPHGAPLDFDRDIEPWFGGEAAVAILPAGGRAAQEVQLLGVGDEDGARRFADSIASGGLHSLDDQGTDLQVDRRGLATALVGGFLVIGTQERRPRRDRRPRRRGRRRVARCGSSRRRRPRRAPGRTPRRRLPVEGRHREAGRRSWLVAGNARAGDRSGRERGRRGGAGRRATRGSSSTSARSSIPPASRPIRASSRPSPRSSHRCRPPSLADSLGYLGIGDPGKTIGSLLEQASASEPGLAAAAGKLTESLKGLGNLDLERELAPALGGEGALALEPSARAAARERRRWSSSAPGSTNRRSPRRSLASRRPVARALGSAGRPRRFSRRRIGERDRVQPSPLADGRAHLRDRRRGAGDRHRPGRGEGGGRRPVRARSDADPFRNATAGLPGEASMLGYLNLGGLIALAERAGPGGEPGIRDLRARDPQARGAWDCGPGHLGPAVDGRPPGGGGGRRRRRHPEEHPTPTDAMTVAAGVRYPRDR